MEEIEQVIKQIEKTNKELYKDVVELPKCNWNYNELNDIECLMSIVSEILQFLEYKFPNALDIMGRPIQRTIFQNCRYRLYKRMNSIRDNKENGF